VDRCARLNRAASRAPRLGLALASLLWILPPNAWADDAEKIAMARLFLTTDEKRAASCTLVGTVRDDSLKDLRKKIVRAGGDTGVLSFPTDDPSVILARAYRCPSARSAPPPPPPPVR
jgi:hypothetical protein